jgi:hypothetical protein
MKDKDFLKELISMFRKENPEELEYEGCDLMLNAYKNVSSSTPEQI